MPLTFPAHQAFVLPLKRRWPSRFDGVALVVSAGMPDLGYALPWLPVSSHSWLGVLLFALPVSLLYARILRRFGAPGLTRLIPSSTVLARYRSVAQRSPGAGVTVGSVLLGSASHVAVDTFTHRGRWGSRTFGLDRLLFTAPNGDFTISRVIQYVGHSVGSVVGLLLLWELARRRPPVPPSRATAAEWFGAVSTAIGGAVGTGVWMRQSSGGAIFIAGFGLAVTLLAASVVVETIAVRARPSAAPGRYC